MTRPPVRCNGTQKDPSDLFHSSCCLRSWVHPDSGQRSTSGTQQERPCALALSPRDQPTKIRPAPLLTLTTPLLREGVF
ncbi:uncharacterized protein MYCFIDRAFT_210544 [Pseudocercospora fijiensis CIRAD86]|uniref:Uncharacterized protein n=1 Tax=Pseudocercospora fijiensis (strain CIRAD86) TaxID=383855 RepID=M3APP7_PSEFD|nr:uncharacterized protein MYCFIDRAFT_210544 [Pseudocercospora fijiensis CIRAD86]EME86591.1 hypothetical protein MYCFIDRAFT_210544 [Pseudocercospora fijiensis CIRAD86]